jgi:hypothetical protein
MAWLAGRSDRSNLVAKTLPVTTMVIRSKQYSQQSSISMCLWSRAPPHADVGRRPAAGGDPALDSSFRVGSSRPKWARNWRSTRPRAAPREGRRPCSKTHRSRIADGCRSCVSVIKVQNPLASRLGPGRVGRVPGHRGRREDCDQRGERTIGVPIAGSVPWCVWRLGGNWSRALGVHEWFLRDGRRYRCEGADRGRRQQYDR